MGLNTPKTKRIGKLILKKSSSLLAFVCELHGSKFCLG